MHIHINLGKSRLNGWQYHRGQWNQLVLKLPEPHGFEPLANGH